MSFKNDEEIYCPNTKRYTSIERTDDTVEHYHKHCIPKDDKIQEVSGNSSHD